MVDNPTEKHQGANRSCGDELTITLRVENGKVKDARFESRACAVCTASADLLLDKVIGQRRALADDITTEDVQRMIGLTLSPIRLKCALLPLETLKTRGTESDSPAP